MPQAQCLRQLSLGEPPEPPFLCQDRVLTPSGARLGMSGKGEPTAALGGVGESKRGWLPWGPRSKRKALSSTLHFPGEESEGLEGKAPAHRLSHLAWSQGRGTDLAAAANGLPRTHTQWGQREKEENREKRLPPSQRNRMMTAVSHGAERKGQGVVTQGITLPELMMGHVRRT